MKKKTILGIMILLTLGVSCSSNGEAPVTNQLDDPVRKQYLGWLDQGKKAIPELKKAVKDDKWRVRSHAVLAMGKTGDAALAPLVLSLLKGDENQAVRNCAVIALGELQDKEAVPYLIMLLPGVKSTEGNVSVSPQLVIKSLGKIGDARAVAPLVGGLLKGSRMTKIAAVEALVAIKDPQASMLILSRRNEFAKRGAARFATMVLGELPVPGAEEYLLERMKDKDLQGKIAAAVALGKVKSMASVPLLVDALATDHSLLQKQSAESLIQINSKDAVGPLIALFDSGKESVMMSSAYALAGMTVPGIAPRVYQKLSSSIAVNAPAAYVLGRKRYKEAAVLLKQRLSDEKLKGQQEMAEALGWIGDRSAIPLLITVVKRKSLDGSTGAVWALGQMKAKESVPALLEVLDRDDARIAPHIIDALGSIGDSRAIVPLIDFQYGTGSKYAKTVGYALGKIGGPKVVAFIKDNIDGDDPAQIMAAGSALIRLHDTSLVPYALTLLDMKNDHARRYAVRYLQKATGLSLKTPQQWKEWSAAKKQ